MTNLSYQLNIILQGAVSHEGECGVCGELPQLRGPDGALMEVMLTHA